MKKIRIENLGQIKKAEIEFGDFNVFVGPQASGKSILLQTMKLMLDAMDIKRTNKKYGYEWKQNPGDFLNLYYGEGMQGIINPATVLSNDDKLVSVKELMQQKRGKRNEELFFIPAQRVITIQNGWPRNFMNYDSLDPYVVKHFSESLRLLMDAGLGSGRASNIFPQEGKMKKSVRDKLIHSIFFDARVELDKSSPKKRIMLSVNGNNLPYMVWSAGQREFMPLLLGLYWLMPSSKISKRKGINWVVIEEPEMGLHPMAIQALLLAFLELMNRGYKVVISTHSPVILELCWVISHIKRLKANPEVLFDLFELPKGPNLKSIFTQVVNDSTFKTFFFNRTPDGVSVKDISSLDPANSEMEEADWGGLTSFSSRVSEIVSTLNME
ncbi:MAG TPA: ATP-binding protein [Bacteroidales bacterium]|nr:ATP-binding protein [Bacteroidales bacterium]HPS61473.1 ATP-binding protein [Bacteroidales bacterium]